jgi:hypothetical protein
MEVMYHININITRRTFLTINFDNTKKNTIYTHMIRKKKGTLYPIHFTKIPIWILLKKTQHITLTGGLFSNCTKRNQSITDAYRLDVAVYIMYETHMTGNIFFAQYTRPRPSASFMRIYYSNVRYFISIKYD